MTTPNIISDLVKRFIENKASYSSSSYNETQLRREFVDPFFKALGWDVDNTEGYAEAYKDVIHEDSIKIGGATKAPDYCFRIGGVRKFFIETKKPSVNLKDDISPAFQVRRYAWSAKLPLSILTDFEEFAVYDCRHKPIKTDKASKGRILYLTYDQYESKWDEIENVFSKQAILKGSFDKYAESAKGKKGTTEVDNEFLVEIERWREILAKNIALRNPELTQRELNFAVQRTIDRIIFLRICEDRGIEHYSTLMGLLNGEHVYERMRQNFKKADDVYNSGLFHFRNEKGRAEPPDTLTLTLNVDDKPLKDIVKNLYYPDSPYEFAVLPADILGQVYERFLGSVIRLTKGHQAKIEVKPEVKKSGGVFYTPTYIVDYIVKNTVGELIENKTPKQIEKMKILDPACGSGTFLIQAYQFLLDYHRDWYIFDGTEKHIKGKSPRLVKTITGEWRLSTDVRKKILLNNIFGVDIDSQAVEVTKLSLLLKVLEGENEQSLSQQLSLFHERALPDLENNIKCGNSLISSNFYDVVQTDLFDDELSIRINAFDWQLEFDFFNKSRGFDIVLGNPPYGAKLGKDELAYLLQVFPHVAKFPDSYCFFIAKAFNLVKSGGLLSYIVPNTWCDLESCDMFRKSFLENFSITNIWQSGWAFKTAVVDTIVFTVQNKVPSKKHSINIFVDDKKYSRKILDFTEKNLYKIDYRNQQEEKDILEKVQKLSIPLKAIATVNAGVKMYEKGKGNPPQTAQTMKETPFSISGGAPKGWRALYRGSDIGKFTLRLPKEYVNYGPWLAAPRKKTLFDSPKILMRRTDDNLKSILEYEDSICVNSCHVIKLKPEVAGRVSYEFLLGILNSDLIQKVFEIQNPQMVGKVFSEIKVIYVERLPIFNLKYINNTNESLIKQIESCAKDLLVLLKRLSDKNLTQEIQLIKRQINAKRKILNLSVNVLYGVSDVMQK